DNVGGQVLQYDGYTAVMQAVAPVIPCETYHLKIVIADAGDGFYDSGVFLEAGSMVSTPVVLAGNDTSVCSGVQVQLGTTPAAGWTYSWTPAAALNSATSSSPVFSAQNTGSSAISTTYIVSATNGSCVLTDSVQITVTPQPVVSFVLPDAVCQFDTVSLSYTISASPNAQVNWVFGGNPATQQGPGPFDLSWLQSGHFPVNLMVQQGVCTDMFSDSIRVNPQPVASFTGGPVSSCIPVGLQVQSSGLNTGITIASANWTFGNGSSATGVSAQHQYTTPGSYAVGLSLCSDQGCCSDTLVDAYVNAFAVPRFTLTGSPPTGCVPHTAVFSAQVDSFGVFLSSADLSFGDGVEESGFSFVHTYTDTGSFDVSYSMCSVEGCCSDTLLPAYIQTYPTPAASFLAQPLSGCSPLDVSFVGTIDTRGAVINSVYWDLGDGTSSAQINPFTHRYESPGFYSVELSICSNQGCCADTLRSDYIEVYREPTAGFRYFPEEPDVFLSRIAFQDESVFADSWEWFFGDGNTAQLSMPIHQYTDTGLYDVLQIVRTLEGCVDSAQQIVDIRPVPSVWIPSAFSPNSDGRNDVFAVKGDYLLAVRWRIYNRWGDLIASGNGIGSSWDGTIRNEPVQEGVYLYEVETEGVRSGAELFRGRVTLIR
ncbi:MAG: PKD domain-containing protein, partial [Bacteroidota bacterium]